jgi:peptidoglycan/LPS O-acetylase OafA/YrhL
LQSGNSGASEFSATGNDHIFGIDSLRALAAIVVMLDHLNLTTPTIFHDHKSGIYAAIRLVLIAFSMVRRQSSFFLSLADFSYTYLKHEKTRN